MKIWIMNHYAIPPSYGGLNRHYYFSKYLSQMGHDVTIFTSSKIHNSDVNFNDGNLYRVLDIDDVEYTFIKTSDYKGNGIKRIFTFLQFPFNMIRTARKFFKEGKPDIIYASSPEIFSAFLAVRYSRKKKIPVVLEVRDIWPQSIVEYTKFTDKNPIIKILYLIEKSIYKNATRLIFTFEGGSEYIRDKGWDIENRGKIDIEKVEYLNNGVDIDEFDKNSDIAVDDKIYPNSDKFKVIYTGSLRRVNCVGKILDIAMSLKEKDERDIEFIIYGDGNEREELQKRISDEGLDNVKIMGHIQKKYIPRVLIRSDLNIMVGEPHPKLYKYGVSPNKVFDYLASGKPLLCTFIPSNKYNLINRNQCGVSMETSDIEDIAQEIINFKNMNSEEYGQYCENARKTALEYDYKNLTLELLEIFKRARGNRSKK